MGTGNIDFEVESTQCVKRDIIRMGTEEMER